MNAEYRHRKRFFRDQQLAGGTYDSAREDWNGADEIADTFLHDGIRTAEELSEGAIHDAIQTWRAIRRAGL